MTKETPNKAQLGALKTMTGIAIFVWIIGAVFGHAFTFGSELIFSMDDDKPTLSEICPKVFPAVFEAYRKGKGTP